MFSFINLTFIEDIIILEILKPLKIGNFKYRTLQKLDTYFQEDATVCLHVVEHFLATGQTWSSARFV